MRVSLVASLGILGTLVGVNCLAQGEKAGKAAAVPTSALERMPESLETLFALSAAPPHLRDSATVFLTGQRVRVEPPRRQLYRGTKRLAI